MRRGGHAWPVYSAFVPDRSRLGCGGRRSRTRGHPATGPLPVSSSPSLHPSCPSSTSVPTPLAALAVARGCGRWRGALRGQPRRGGVPGAARGPAGVPPLHPCLPRAPGGTRPGQDSPRPQWGIDRPPPPTGSASTAAQEGPSSPSPAMRVEPRLRDGAGLPEGATVLGGSRFHGEGAGEPAPRG